jgi:hypothetical protein
VRARGLELRPHGDVSRASRVVLATW